ncbi:MAG: replicative DNA helicase [Bacilli bacterium]|jgi:replicative DNA helicase
MAKVNLPRNTEAEKAILGAMLISPEALNDCLGSLEEDMFYDDPPSNKLVFRAMRQLQDKHIPVDAQTVGDELINMKEAESVGGLEYLAELCDSAISLSNLEHYIRLVKDQAVLRNLLVAMDKIEQEYSKEEIIDISDFVASAEERINKVAEGRSISTFLNSEELAKRVKESIDNTISQGDGITGLDTGYSKLNRLTLGFQKSDMLILAARPSVGKTALALNFAYKISRRDVPVAIFSAEMPAVTLVKRLISAESKINLSKIMSNKLTDGERYAVQEAIRNIAKTKIYIDESPNIKLMDLMAKSRKLKVNCPDLGLIIIDYIGLVKTSEKNVESRQQEVSDISRLLKQLARELNIPILVICQLSRDSEKRDNKRPLLSDLRESGAIEQDADVVMLLYDEYKYKSSGEISIKRSPSMVRDEKLAKTKEAAYQKLYSGLITNNTVPITLIVAKNRNGATDDVSLHFAKNYGLFMDPSPEFLAEKKRIDEMTEGLSVD